MYQMLQRLNLEALNVPALRTMTQAGGKLQDSLIGKFHALMEQRGGRFLVMYGQTEATARMAVLPAESLPGKLGSVGKAIPGGSLALEKEGRAVTAPFAEGELVYTGPNVMMGYGSNREDLARGAGTDRLYTGDLGHFDEDGFFYITGRNKRFAKVLGLRINLDEVESLLKANGPTAVVGGVEQLLVYCEYGGDQDFAAYAHSLGHQLKLHPSVFVFRRIDSMPLNSNGKPDYQRLATE
jgi:acyl-CoA synthetase (AMP-forming)/AMP-acid ligase II